MPQTQQCVQSYAKGNIDMTTGIAEHEEGMEQNNRLELT